MKKTNEKPANTITRGSISAVIWKNRRRDGGFFYNVELVRNYKNSSGDWEESKSFPVNDLLMVQKVADEAFDWVYEQLDAKRIAARNAAVNDGSEEDSDDDSEE